MQRLITYILFLGLVSPILCLSSSDVPTKMKYFNVIDYGACGNGSCDDSNAILSAWQSVCESEVAATLVIPPNKIFFVKRIMLNGPCKAPSVIIRFQGKLVPPSKNAWVGDSSGWIVISYVKGLTFDGNGGIIDGYGATWWNKCKHCTRPRALSFHSCNGLTVNSLRMINSPKAHITVNGCDGARFSQININAPRHSPNTDGFDISYSKNILIEDSAIGTGDDCVAINGGSSYINITRVFCGPGHGISIGSLGKNKAHEIVEEIYVQNCSFIKTTNGARIKTWPGGSGYARKIIFDQIELRDTSNSIIIDQYYGFKHPPPTNEAVQVSEVTFREFEGTSTGGRTIELRCSRSGCFNITLDQIHIVSSQPSKPAYAICENVHGTIGSTIPKVSCL